MVPVGIANAQCEGVRRVMADDTKSQADAGDLLNEMVRAQSEAMTTFFGQLTPAQPDGPDAAKSDFPWADVVQKICSLWSEHQAEQAGMAVKRPSHYSDPAKWMATAEGVLRQLPLANPETQQKLWEDGLNLFETVLGQYGIGPKATEAGEEGPELPRSDRRFADPKWREEPFFALLHQAYLMLSEELVGMAERVEFLEPTRKAQLLFATRMLVDSISPSNFPLTNPVALDRAVETGGKSMVSGMEHFLADLKRGQLTHTNREAFTVGGNIANTPGKVVHETALYQLIQYTPVTDKVLKVPLIVFPPWINRFYILDLNEKKSFVRWAVEQGLTVFMVSWKSADETMAEIVWDDYIAAQIDVIEFVCDRLKVPSAHTIGYCVAGTTLAATLAVMARKGLADKVKSATFFTAQVDFEDAGDLKHFIDDEVIETIGCLSPEGYLDGRYMAATFNLLRGKDLIWSYVEKNYLKGEDYPAFDLLYWNGDVTNLPVKWHQEYLRELYRDNRLVLPDSLEACGVPIDLRKIETPCYIQAGREDHIAPPESVWKLTYYLSGPWTFVLAGSGHIAGVVNPPAVNKYQYWTNDGPAESLPQFVEGATEHPGSWWPHWNAWLRGLDSGDIAARGKRKPGGKGDEAIEDAPGRYVMTR